ncbi:MAG: nickel pincer cofactor biosynthesis protein LarC, partial [Gemmatimonadota bacterium]
MRALIIDPFAGISGDMFLGALVDLGLSEAWLRSYIDSLGLDVGLTVEQVDRSGIACTRVALQIPEEAHHRHLADVLKIVRTSGAAEPVRSTAEAVFRRLAEAEAAVHGVPVEAVHFHEVGALDSIVDVLAVIAGVREMGFEACYTRPVAVGSGTVDMGHGTYPLPAPATARLLQGVVVRETEYPEECTTPTGAALVRELTGGRRPPVEVTYGASGFGAGSRNPERRANCLRLLECRVAGEAGGEGTGREAVYALQADVDDLAPEYLAGARARLMAAGALDVAVLRVDMKKGRPGTRLEALATASTMDRVVAAFFAATTTIGLRYWP